MKTQPCIRNKLRIRSKLVSLVSALLMAACGGGGNGSTSPPNTAIPLTAPTSSPTPTQPSSPTQGTSSIPSGTPVASTPTNPTDNPAPPSVPLITPTAVPKPQPTPVATSEPAVPPVSTPSIAPAQLSPVAPAQPSPVAATTPTPTASPTPNIAAKLPIICSSKLKVVQKICSLPANSSAGKVTPIPAAVNSPAPTQSPPLVTPTPTPVPTQAPPSVTPTTTPVPTQAPPLVTPTPTPVPTEAPPLVTPTPTVPISVPTTPVVAPIPPVVPTPAPQPTPALTFSTQFMPCTQGGLYNDSNGNLVDNGSDCTIIDTLSSTTHASLSLGEAWGSSYAQTINGIKYAYVVLALGSDGNVKQSAVQNITDLASGNNWYTLNSSTTASSKTNGGFPLGISFIPGMLVSIGSNLGHNLSGLLNSENNGYGSAWCGNRGGGCSTELNASTPMAASLIFSNGELRYILNAGIWNGNKTAYLTSAAYNGPLVDLWDSECPNSNSSYSYVLVIAKDVTIKDQPNTAGGTASLAWSTKLP